MGLDLKLRGLRWCFPKTGQAFLDIPSFDLPAGASLALGGPSGSGKSSLLFLLSGMEAPAAGEIAWGGQDLARLGEARRDAWRRSSVGLVFQDFRLVPGLSVLDNVLLPSGFSAWRPSRALRARAFDLIGRVGLADPRQRAATLSRGEMQRAAIARALLFDPPVVLADEPTASLDAENEEKVAELLFAACAEGGATLVVATHQPRLFDRAARTLRLQHGRVEESV